MTAMKDGNAIGSQQYGTFSLSKEPFGVEINGTREILAPLLYSHLKRVA